MLGKKGEASMWENIGAIILVVIFVLLITGGGQQIWAYFKDTTTKVRSCEGMGFVGGVCVAENAIADCAVQIEGLGCKGSESICCFKSESDSASSSVPVGLTGDPIITPDSARVGESVIISCDTTAEARGCIVIEYGTNNRLICQTETWTAFTSGRTRVNRVQFSCFAPAPAGRYNLRCKVDETRCSYSEGNGERETGTETLTVRA